MLPIHDVLDDLKAAVAAHKADLGIAFDGDADRIGIIDDKGRVIWGDQILALLSREVLGENPGAAIIADVKASQMLFDEVARLGGRPIMWKTGHALIKTKMLEEKSALAGEMSGHIFFADKFYGFDDALYVALRFLGLVASGKETVSALRDSLPTAVNTPELRFDCDDAEKFVLADRVKANLKARGARLDDTDGVRVMTDEGWWLLRASNTQAVLVARCEARDEAGLARVKQDLRTALQEAGIAVPSDL